MLKLVHANNLLETGSKPVRNRFGNRFDDRFEQPIHTLNNALILPNPHLLTQHVRISLSHHLAITISAQLTLLEVEYL